MIADSIEPYEIVHFTMRRDRSVIIERSEEADRETLRSAQGDMIEVSILV